MNVLLVFYVFLPRFRSSIPLNFYFRRPYQFYRVQVAIQSPEGITSTRLILRRFNDFLDLYSSVSTSSVRFFFFNSSLLICFISCNVSVNNYDLLA